MSPWDIVHVFHSFPFLHGKLALGETLSNLLVVSPVLTADPWYTNLSCVTSELPTQPSKSHPLLLFILNFKFIFQK